LPYAFGNDASGMNADVAIVIALEAYGVLTPLLLLALIFRLAAVAPNAD
jgi:hypothetical protein